jgi:hypothetical protein
MKLIPIGKALPVWIAIFLLSWLSRAAAQIDATAWTSADGTTIWARLDGLDGNKVILHLRGRTYRVPISKLAPKSLDKLGRMMGQPPERIRELAAARPSTTESVPFLSKARERKPASKREALPAPDRLRIAEPRVDDGEIPGGQVASARVDGPEILDPTGQLPELGVALDPDHAGYGAVLPPRDPSAPGRIPEPGPVIRMLGKTAIAPAGIPDVIRIAVEAGNRLQTKYYKWGGGRARLEDSGYDCSGSVSYVLIRAGLLDSVLHSSAFTRYGAPGPGKWITIYARNGHVFMTICGLRLDTGGSGGRGESGPRWRPHMRGTSGFVMRHPPGF